MWARPSANTDEVYIQIAVPTGTVIKIKKISVNGSNGLNTGINDIFNRIRFQICSTVSASDAIMLAFTPVKRDANNPPSACTVKLRNDSAQASVPGTLVTEIDLISLWSQQVFEWNAYDDDGCIVVLGGQWFDLVRSDPTTAGNSISCSIVWEEL